MSLYSLTSRVPDTRTSIHAYFSEKGLSEILMHVISENTNEKKQCTTLVLYKAYSFHKHEVIVTDVEEKKKKTKG